MTYVVNIYEKPCISWCGYNNLRGENMNTQRKLVRTAYCIMVATMLAVALSVFAAGQVETIDATARGTSTQMGRTISIKVIVSQFSTPEDREVLKDAFLKSGNEGLVNALSKMKSAGRIQIPGTVGYDLAYVEAIPTPSGRRIRFVTNRKIAFGEAYRDTQSKAYNLTAGEIAIDDQDKNKSAGVLYPAAQLIINTDGQLELALRKNPWQLTNIIDWKPKAKE
jgi:hypothetical protein